MLLIIYKLLGVSDRNITVLEMKSIYFFFFFMFSTIIIIYFNFQINTKSNRPFQCNTLSILWNGHTRKS